MAFLYYFEFLLFILSFLTLKCAQTNLTIVSNSFFAVYNSFGLKSCAVEVVDVQHTCSSYLKCVIKCSAAAGCSRCNYHYDNRTCQFFTKKTTFKTGYLSSDLCISFQKRTSGNEPLNNEWSSRYLGCYKDIYSPKDMPYWETRVYDLTIQTGWNKCRIMNYTFIGLQYGSDNFCSDTYGRYGVGAGCTYPCGGSPVEKCGGYFFNSVYSVCDIGMYGLNCNQNCSCGPQCLCNRLTGFMV
ncbi:hypothetical protein HELRODRAFT_179323 [Helobdella robusta]|uniref:WSC domain-containing protein n=1 Tax=Helobdella robusta TaxID=6412 RepID=T1FEJ6_HELRO|nr:hypothetical protein HELRODRAFT_179323 [Helobdella robusta]ESN95547.1 hypothetical protein HELRODRAFT_179323 [Helobdella robusta]